jgi:hypothetical protein
MDPDEIKSNRHPTVLRDNHWASAVITEVIIRLRTPGTSLLVTPRHQGIAAGFKLHPVGPIGSGGFGMSHFAGSVIP